MPTAPRFMRSPLIAVFILAFMLLPADLMALMGFGANGVTFKILDAARYHAPDITSLEVEIIDSTDDDIFSPGRHFNVWAVLSPDSGIKIGQTLQADFSGSKDRFGQISAGLDPNTVVIIDDNPSCVEIPWSIWEPVFEYLPALKIAFILFWWLVVILLVSKKITVTS